MFANATGRRADVLLPACSWLERWDFASTTVSFQTDALVQIGAPVMAPLGESRNDVRILGDLAAVNRHPELDGADTPSHVADLSPR